MAHEIVMPMLGMTMVEGKLTKWLKKEGDTITRGEALFELETEKLTNTFEALAEGVLLKITGVEGETYPCFAQLGIIGEPGEDISGLLAKSASGAPAAEAQTETAAAATPAAVARQPGERIIASPAARKLARDNNVDLAGIAPTGPNGRIVLHDVESYLASPAPRASGLAKKMAAELGVDIASVPAAGRVMAADVMVYARSGAAEQLEERIKMNGMRRTIARRMSESHTISPTVNYVISADVTALGEAKSSLAAGGVAVSYTDLLVKIVSKALLEFPNLNCSIEGDEIVLRHYVNMGVAVALQDGLVVPVLKNAHVKGLAEISSELRDLASCARDGRLGPDAMSGGTFTISNLGMFGIESFTPIINQPEVAILGVNAIMDTVVVVDGAPAVRPIMKLSLTADHRAADGAVAAAFLARVKVLIESPALLLA